MFGISDDDFSITMAGDLVVGSQVIKGLVNTIGLCVGMTIAAVGIPEDATVLAIDELTGWITASADATATGHVKFAFGPAEGVAYGNLTFNSPVICSVSWLELGAGLVGMPIAGDGVPSEAVIASVDVALRQITMSADAVKTIKTALTVGSAEQWQSFGSNELMYSPNGLGWTGSTWFYEYAGPVSLSPRSNVGWAQGFRPVKVAVQFSGPAVVTLKVKTSDQDQSYTFDGYVSGTMVSLPGLSNDLTEIELSEYSGYLTVQDVMFTPGKLQVWQDVTGEFTGRTDMQTIWTGSDYRSDAGFSAPDVYLAYASDTHDRPASKMRIEFSGSGQVDTVFTDSSRTVENIQSGVEFNISDIDMNNFWPGSYMTLDLLAGQGGLSVSKIELLRYAVG
jgi:hypothetical protein